jgi:hypothetical protein
LPWYQPPLFGATVRSSLVLVFGVSWAAWSLEVWRVLRHVFQCTSCVTRRGWSVCQMNRSPIWRLATTVNSRLQKFYTWLNLLIIWWYCQDRPYDLC